MGRRVSASVFVLGMIVGIENFAGAQETRVPEPIEVLGFDPGEDFRLAPWKDVVDYFERVGRTSDRVKVFELGRSTQDRPFLFAVVSSEETIANLDRYKNLQRRLAQPDMDESTEESSRLVEQSKTTVLITCSIHSSETASTLMACSLLHELATSVDPEMTTILDETILLLVPSVNPDGVDIVQEWYERSKGNPWEGAGLPWLYHPYAGHDTNRDWFMLNLTETRLLTKLLYEEWFPTITWDVHQMGSTGPRLFVPPFYDPVNPNLDPRISQGIFLIGAHLAADLAKAGKKGVATHAMYDNWWNGGNRTVPQRHNMVGILTEAASVKLASPIFQSQSDLRGGSRGFPDHEPRVTFVDPWPGGWWRMADIIEYELISARALLTLAARYKDWFQSNYRAVALDQIKAGADEPPFAWVIPANQRDPGTAAKLVEILHATGIQVHRSSADFEAAGVEYPEGSWIFFASQPYRAHLKDMMERQHYPNRLNADGRPERPYDVAGWTLALQMGVKVAEIVEPFEVECEPVETVDPAKGLVEGEAHSEFFVIENRANDDFKVLNALLDRGRSPQVLTKEMKIGDDSLPVGSLLISAEGGTDAILQEVIGTTSSRAIGQAGPMPEPSADLDGATNLNTIAPRRVGLYQPWRPSMDEGWTRLVLEQFDFSYETLHNADIRGGDLNDRIDVLVIPSISGGVLREGYRPDQTEPRYVGGLGDEGIKAIQDFVEAGGTLVCFDSSCPYFISELELPVKNVLQGVSSDEFYCPGSILSVRYGIGHSLPNDRGGYLVRGMPEEGSVYFSNSMGFEVDPDEPNEGMTSIVCQYASSRLLESGWLLGESYLEDAAAVVETHLGEGRVVLFGFPPQHRGQPHGTFRLLFNALIGPGSPAE